VPASLLSRTSPLSRPAWDDAQDRPHVMVAEDDAAMRRLLTRVLVRERYRVTALEDGKALLAAALALRERGEAPDLIISDVRMPEFSGFHLLEALGEARLRVPVVLISAFCDEPTLTRAAQLNATLVLSKPFDMDVLRTAALCLLAAK
jgi:CheY-like chemotaxis protein